MAPFPLFVSKSGTESHRFELCVIRKNDLGTGKTEELTNSSSHLSPNSAILLESEDGDDDSIGSTTSPVKNAIRNSKHRSLDILATDTAQARWYIVSFLTVPQEKHEELLVKFQTYTEQIFKNPKFDPVFAYLAPLASGSDVLLSVWGFKRSRDAGVYMPSKEHVEFGNSVQSYFTGVDFFQARVVDLKEEEEAKL